ncbi:MAG: hypothetical protein EZS28_022820 [Streblomastix strix]|uniref:ABC3 transporter permease C-terminal domain-containing protein n=1 Tax=Streblomastix strix TaxID=222440 RepID=A0A5J4VH46_9EUKA|nr:MAG: hypothetical protein EZS28_022820 [Streblomastix strix]
MKAQPFFANPPVTISVTNYGEAPLSIPTFLSLFPDGFSDYENDLKWKYLIIRFKKKDKEEEEQQEDQQELEEEEQEDQQELEEQGDEQDDEEEEDDEDIEIPLSKKEIGIQRAIGITRFQLMRVYIEEAFILVFSAAVMGMLVGIIMGYILTSQATVMQGLPIPFIFPWQLILVSIAMAIIVAIIASAGPSWSVVSSNIVIVMRST